MKSESKGRTALVTGAGRGIGRAIALSLASQGMSVALVSRTRHEVESVSSEISSSGGNSLPLVADVSDQGEVDQSVQYALDHFGKVDILVNNAGSNVVASLQDSDPEVWWQQIAINLRGPYFYCKALIPQMMENGWGRIINISSALGKVGSKNSTAYCAAKHGLIGLTRSLAMELATYGITVNSICPGYVETELTHSTFSQRARLSNKSVDEIVQGVLKTIPQKRAGTVEEISHAVLFLASEGSGFITGEALNVSGGMVMT